MENNESTTAPAEGGTEASTETPEVPEIKDPAGLLKAYEQAKADLVSLRNEHKELKTQFESAPKGEEWKTRAVNAEVKLALNSQGIKDTDRVMKYVNTEGLDFDENGNLTGLNERLNELKKDLPELFDVKRQVGGKADIFANDATEVKQDPFVAQIKAALSR